MNKKLLAILVAAIPAGNLLAQNSDENNTSASTESSNETVKAEKTGFSHWSLQVHGGFNRMNDLADYNHGICGNWCLQPMVGGQVEYTFTQYWGLGIDYTFNKNEQTWYDGKDHSLSVFASLNLSNLLAPHRTWDKFSAYANLGLGTSISCWKDAYYVGEDGVKHEIEDDNMWTRPFIQPGLNLEYNINNHWAVGVNVSALISLGVATNDDNNSIFHPTVSGGKSLYMGGIGLRYKFAGNRNIRNLAIPDAQNESEELQNQLDQLSQQQNRKVDSISAEQNERIANLAAENAELKKAIKAQQTAIDSLAKSKATAAAKPTVFTLSTEESKQVNTSLGKITFENGKATIKKVSNPGLDNIAQIIKNHPECDVVLSGYTDNTGDAQKNVILSKDRAAAVKAYLVNKGIDESRIQAFGYGADKPVASNATAAGRAKNRRVELQFYVR